MSISIFSESLEDLNRSCRLLSYRLGQATKRVLAFGPGFSPLGAIDAAEKATDPGEPSEQLDRSRPTGNRGSIGATFALDRV
jgi:hypothetical protein